MIKESNPYVSVIMPSYNSADFIELAVNSVLQQTFDNFELIIIDDCSSDNTRDILQKISKTDERIRLVLSDKNEGAAITRNKGLDLCRGAFVALIDSDDIWAKEKLELQVAAAQSSNADIVYCSYSIIDENGNKKCREFIVPEKTDFKHTLNVSVISCSTALLSRKIVDKYRFPTDFYHEDYALWLSILKDGHSAAGLTEVLAEYRVRGDSRASNKLSSAKNRWNIYRKFLHLPLTSCIFHFVQYGVLGFIKYKNI